MLQGFFSLKSLQMSYGSPTFLVVLRETIDTINWINEKDLALSSEDVGKDLPHVAALQRNHENLERDLEALADKVRDQLCNH